MLRIFNETEMKQVRHSLIPAVFIVFRKNGLILLMRRFNTGYADGMLTPPAGHVEAGEQFTQAAIREAHEEVGVKICREDLVPFHIIHRRIGNSPERIDVYFQVTFWEGEFVNKEPHKCSELLWVPEDALPGDLLVASQHSITQGLQGVLFSEFLEP
jgi:8-oxo-dGTP diphosphatase